MASLPGGVIHSWRTLRYGYEGYRFTVWSDAEENVAYAFAIAHGDTAYADFVSNHSPGVYVALSWFFEGMGFGQVPPSGPAASVLIVSSVLITAIAQCAFAFCAARLAGAGRLLAAFLASGVVWYFTLVWETALPLSETLLGFLWAVCPPLLLRLLVSRTADERATFAAILVGPFTMGCLWLGLTTAPSNVFVAGMVVLGPLMVSPWGSRPSRRAVAISAGIVIGTASAISLVTHPVVDSSSLVASVVDFNLEAEPELGLLARSRRISAGLIEHLTVFDRAFPFLGRVPVAAVLIAWSSRSVFLRSEAPRRTVAVAYYVTTLFGAALLMLWRTTFTFKSFPLVGIALGSLLISVVSHRERFTPSFVAALRGRSISTSLVGAMAIAIVSLVLIVAIAATERLPQKGNRPPELDRAEVCRRGEAGNCRCLQVLQWSPGLYLKWDVQSCPGRFAQWPFAAGRVEATRRALLADLSRRDVAFYVEPGEALVKNGVPSEAIGQIRRTHTCLRSVGSSEICFLWGGGGE